MQTQKVASMTALLGLLVLAPSLAWSACAGSWTGSKPGTLMKTFEAEAGTLAGNMTQYTDSAASGGKSVYATGSNSTASTSCSGGSNGCDSFSFTPTATGNYMIEGQFKCSGTSNNSFFVYVTGINDCNSVSNARWEINTTGTTYSKGFVTDDTTDVADTAANARIWYLTAGTAYTIVFHNREDTARLDLINLYLDPADVPATPTPTKTTTPTTASGTGLCSYYYPNKTLSGASSNSGVSLTAVSFDWGAGTPVGVGLSSADNYSSRYTGWVQFPWAGSYTLTIGGDDGVQLWVGCLTCTAYAGNWNDEGYTEWAGVPINVTAGAKYAIKVEYYENGGDASVQLKWNNGVEISTDTVIPQNRLYNSGCTAPTSTPTPAIIPSPTVTPTLAPTVWMGLPPARRLYGLEYIPFPVVNSTSSFRDLSYPATTSTNNDVSKNTARYRIVLTGMPQGETDIETRVGPFGVTCTTGYFNINDYATATSLVLPDRPQNLSTTYAWVSDVVPYTERIDVMGDPRYMPYSDFVDLPAGQAFAGNYNWYFKDISNSGLGDYQATYLPFLTKAVNDHYSGGAQPNLDVPKFFRLWREGILLTNSIYTSMTGWSSYYIGVGGEIGGDSSNKLSGGVPLYNGPWNASSSGDQDEITGSATLVRTSTWYSRPYIGELWPDSSYLTDWSNSSTVTVATYGNLRNTQQGGTAYRQSWEGTTAAGLQTFTQVQHRNGSVGCATFMNGNGGSSTFNHSSTVYNASWLYDSQIMSQDYNFAMPTTFAVTRPFGLNLGGNTPPEWSSPPYSTSHLTLDLYSASSQAATNIGFYAWSSNSTDRASAAVRGLYNNNVGWFVVNGLAPATDSGLNFVARFAILSCLRTFQEAGAPAASSDGVFNGRSPVTTKNRISGVSYRIEPIPWVKITDPTVGQDLSGYATINFKWTTRYVRWDNQRYTENYPCIDDTTGPCTPADPTKVGNPDLEWHSLTGTALAYNIIYSTNGGTSWISALTGSPASPGVYMDTIDSIPGTSSNYTNYSWDVSGLPSGTKKVRVECFRPNITEHYGYHEISIVTAP